MGECSRELCLDGLLSLTSGVPVWVQQQILIQTSAKIRDNAQSVVQSRWWHLHLVKACFYLNEDANRDSECDKERRSPKSRDFTDKIPGWPRILT